MTRIVNILAKESIQTEFVRQPIEFYLAHKILEDPAIYKAASIGNSYKIVDCSACELGTGVSMKAVLKAARIVRASEIILPDKVRDDNSLQMSLDALNTLTSKELNEFKIAIVIQGHTLRSALSSLHTLCANHDAMVMIDTIMIPKWFTTSARVILTERVKKLAPKKNIHWLGLGSDIGYCITKAKELHIRSMDTGYFLSVAQNKMTDVIKQTRDMQHVIDLDHNSLKAWQIAEVIEAVNNYNYSLINDSSCRVVESMKDREFMNKTLRIFWLTLLICIILLFVFFMR